MSIRSLPLLIVGVVLLPCAHRAAAQNQTVGCGSPAEAAEGVEWLRPRFVASDTLYVHYRTANGLQQLDSTAVMEGVSDPTICVALSAKLHEEMPTWRTWSDVWASATWVEHYLRFGPYYVVVVSEVPRAGVVGGSSEIVMYDVQTLTPIPLTVVIVG
jgi:hypothetical protein